MIERTLKLVVFVAIASVSLGMTGCKFISIGPGDDNAEVGEAGETGGGGITYRRRGGDSGQPTLIPPSQGDIGRSPGSTGGTPFTSLPKDPEPEEVAVIDPPPVTDPEPPPVVDPPPVTEPPPVVEQPTVPTPVIRHTYRGVGN